MNIFPFLHSFLSLAILVQSQGIIEIDWPEGCGQASPVIATAAEAPTAASTQIDIPHPALTHDNPSPPAAKYATQTGPFSNPSAYPEDSIGGHSQQESSPKPQSTNQKLDGDVHFGNLTYFDVGLGACGQDSTGQGETGNIVALSKFLYDPANIDNNPNHNPLCGRTIIIKGNNKISHATVLDRCEGCEINDIDVSHKVFKEIWGSLFDGRTDIQWWYS
ncbi:Allergen Asp f 7 [Fusarium mundagurra]|uniref:Allergen Asp f 7 n=1 Tax=Fusarium mundagurra TaxID=1567541 RepID=A0A8H6D935_9HYPO|nr:Allergen Asp f 7 [Fusarium mundagurra]